MDEPKQPPAAFSIPPPVEPMLAKLAETLPESQGFLYEAEVGRVSRHRLPP
jgi:hypothetical protein